MSLQDEAATGEEDISLADALSKAFDTVTAAEAPAPGEASPEADKAAPAASGEGPARDEHGRFAKAPETAQNDISKPSDSVTGAEPAATQTITPPAGWSATAKAKFASLEPDIQAEILKREGDIERGKAQWQSGAERLNRLDQVLSPLQERLRVNGVDEATFVGQLVAANNMLDQDPINAMLELGRLKGVNWGQLVARLQGQPMQPPQGQGAPLPPQFSALGQQVQQLTQWAQQREQLERQSVLSSHQSEIDRFRADPANVYFENVRGAMSNLIRAGQATTLKDAYDQACWANPEIRGLLLADQAKQQAEANKARVAQARQAAGSLTGSPSPGAPPGGQRPSNSSLKETLSDVWDALS